MIEIREIADQEGFAQCEQLQKRIWGFENPSVIPRHLMITAQRNGGVLLGAYHGERLVGFVFGFLGIEEGKPKHCSMMVGVLPEARYQGIGYQLKLAQREHVISQGLDLATWTFDPLQSPNAYFNFAKLGAVSRTYERDLYGEMRDKLNRGLASDRLTVEWWVKSPRVLAKIEQRYRPPTIAELIDQGAEPVNRTEMRGGWLGNVEYHLDLNRAQLLVEIPPDLEKLKERNLKLAQEWRRETREIFAHYLQEGYIVSEFIVEGQKRRGYYLLEREIKEELLYKG